MLLRPKIHCLKFFQHNIYEVNGEIPTRGSGTDSKFLIKLDNQCFVLLSPSKQESKVESLSWSGRHCRNASRALENWVFLEFWFWSNFNSIFTLDYPRVSSSIWRHASRVLKMALWPMQSPFFPLKVNFVLKVDAKLDQENLPE